MKFNKTVLENGLRLITVPMKDNPTATVLVIVEAGSKYETKDIGGISHFLEHMCFKGTTKRPSALDITKELDGIGAQYNAFTSQEFTGYYAKSDYKHVNKILDAVSDIYLNSTFPEKELEKEKGVIIEEINMYQDLPNRHVGDLFMELLYGDQPAGWNVAGTKETVSNTTREAMISYKNKHYVPSATTVVVSGNINEVEIRELVEKHFAGIENGEKHGKEKVVENQSAPAIKVEYKKTDQTHLILGVRTFDIYDKRNPVLRVLSAILGGGMSSRLFQKIREEMGVGYYIRAGNDTSTDHGSLDISAGVDHKRVKEVVEAILAELLRLKNEKVSEEELQKTKDYLNGNLFLSLESSDSLAEYYGAQEILKKELRLPDVLVEEINKVTSDDVLEMANLVFKDSGLNIALVGPVKEEDFKDILHF